MREKEIERKSEGERVGSAAPETVAARELVSESLDERKRFCTSGPKVDSYLPVSHKNILCYPQYERTKRVYIHTYVLMRYTARFSEIE